MPSQLCDQIIIAHAPFPGDDAVRLRASSPAHRGSNCAVLLAYRFIAVPRVDPFAWSTSLSAWTVTARRGRDKIALAPTRACAAYHAALERALRRTRTSPARAVWHNVFVLILRQQFSSATQPAAGDLVCLRYSWEHSARNVRWRLANSTYLELRLFTQALDRDRRALNTRAVSCSPNACATAASPPTQHRAWLNLCGSAIRTLIHCRDLRSVAWLVCAAALSLPLEGSRATGLTRTACSSGLSVLNLPFRVGLQLVESQA